MFSSNAASAEGRPCGAQPGGGGGGGGAKAAKFVLVERKLPVEIVTAGPGVTATTVQASDGFGAIGPMVTISNLAGADATNMVLAVATIVPAWSSAISTVATVQMTRDVAIGTWTATTMPSTAADDSGVAGTFRRMTSSSAASVGVTYSPFNYAKHRIDEIDEHNYTCKYTFIEGDALMDKLDHITYQVKFEPYGYGGCVCKVTSEYYTKDNVEIKEEDIEHGKDRAIGMYEVVEAYLLAHPHSYT
ncbi:Unknown protein [Striga hermonthica]|uniref:Bet v I/Major latex protein domain-containing protein n=1 Tax=Striga hermonthica TaxID=68872 RepID=A0A9N7MXV9_STRHE|nr:Unknown protein [Striga hermonthica]